MKKLCVAVMLSIAVLLNACAGGQSTIGNGKVDLVEAATIQVAVGLAFSAKPQTIVPAYAVSTALLKIMSKDQEKVIPSMIKDMVKLEIDKLKLDALTKASMLDLYQLIEAEVKSKIDLQIDASNKMIIIQQLVQIVHDSAEARMGIITAK